MLVPVQLSIYWQTWNEAILFIFFQIFFFTEEIQKEDSLYCGRHGDSRDCRVLDYLRHCQLVCFHGNRYPVRVTWLVRQESGQNTAIPSLYLSTCNQAFIYSFSCIEFLCYVIEWTHCSKIVTYIQIIYLKTKEMKVIIGRVDEISNKPFLLWEREIERERERWTVFIWNCIIV